MHLSWHLGYVYQMKWSKLKSCLSQPLGLASKAMRLPKNFAISRKSKVESRIVSTVENRPV